MTKDLAQYLMNIQVPLFHKLKPKRDPPCNYGPSLWWHCGSHRYNLVTISAESYKKKICCVLKHCWNKYRKHIFISAYMHFNKCSLTSVLFPTFSMNRFLRHVTTLPWSSSSFFWVCRTFLQNLGMSNRHFFWSSGFNL